MEAVLYMNKNFGSKIDSETLCSISAMCYSDFFKYFKTVCGVPFTQYLRQLRVQMAKFFIVFSRYSLDYIANICGLCDRTYMSKLYTKYFEYTIREERARQEKNRRDYPFMNATHDSIDKLNLEFQHNLQWHFCLSISSSMVYLNANPEYWKEKIIHFIFRT